MSDRVRLFGLLGLLALAAGVITVWQWPNLRQLAYSQTGEEDLLPQVRGLLQRASDFTRPPLRLEPDVPIAHTGVNPFGINTFLEQEVEVEKRDLQLQLISEAGFGWIRQEFPWYDIEIHAKDDFEDRRFEPYRSAWDKYDNIVELAEKYDIQIIARLSSPPEWSRAVGNDMGAFAPPDNFGDYADYAAAVASRYAGRVTYFQIWNEPNIYPEWGEQTVNPEAYTDMLCQAYAAIKAANPDAIVLSAALAPTASLSERDLNDFIYLERMYAAGFSNCYDIMSMQGYGLWSGPTDSRLRPVVINYARNQFIRDMMVAHGEAHKPIWISEMNWNAVPPETGIYPNYGQVTLEEQAAFAPQAYARAQQEWPWVGVVSFWFFKRAADYERGESWYYFRMAEPDFTLMPVYDSMAEYANQPPVLYRGVHQEDHWGIWYSAEWQRQADPNAILGHYMVSTAAGATLSVQVSGGSVWLTTHSLQPDTRLQVRLVGRDWQTLSLEPSPNPQTILLTNLPAGSRTLEIQAVQGPLVIDSLQIRPASTPPWPMLVVLLIVLLGLWRAMLVRPATNS